MEISCPGLRMVGSVFFKSLSEENFGRHTAVAIKLFELVVEETKKPPSAINADNIRVKDIP